MNIVLWNKKKKKLKKEFCHNKNLDALALRANRYIIEDEGFVEVNFLPCNQEVLGHVSSI
jgi:hypothetical protein